MQSLSTADCQFEGTSQSTYIYMYCSWIQLYIVQLNVLFISVQEFIAYGLSNIAGSFFSSINVSGSLSRSLVQANAGGKTQVSMYMLYRLPW